MADSYRDVIAEKYNERVRKNPQYSLRAFARDLEMSSSRLSEILNRKQGLSLATAKSISKKLNLSKSHSDYFCELVMIEHSRSKQRRKQAAERLGFLKEQILVQHVQIDAFEMIANWYHLPILEMTHLENFQSNPNWVATQLGITTVEAEEGIERLQRLGFLAIENGKYISISPKTQVRSPSEKRSEGLKKYHLQMIQKGMKQIEKPLNPNRDISTLVVSLKASQFSEFKEMLSEFRRSMAQKCDNQPEKDQVYCLSMQFFPLTDE